LLLKRSEYNPSTDQLVLLGDYMDRGPKSKQALELVMDLAEDGAITLRGNHDQMFLDFMNDDTPRKAQHYMANGGQKTLETYVGSEHFADGVTLDNLKTAKTYIKENYPEHIDFMSRLFYYYEMGNHLFIHAGFDPTLDDWKDTSKYDMIWIRAPFLEADHPYNFTVVHGHTPAQVIRGEKDDSIYFGDKKIGIDGACAYGGRLNCLIINGEKYTICSC
jgi:serine/threonine protein phosphatase 1